MTTCHGGTGCTGQDGDLNSHIDITTEGDTGGIDIGLDNDNESTQFRHCACHWRIRGGW